MKKAIVILNIFFPIWISGLVDLPRAIQFGPITLLAVLTIIYAVGAWSSCCLIFKAPKFVLSRVMPLILFITLGGVSLIWYQPTVPGFQLLMSLVAFVGLVLLSGTLCYYDPSISWKIGRAIVAATWLAALLYAGSLLVGGFEATEILSPRGFSLMVLVGLSWHLANWRYEGRSGIGPAVGLVSLVVLSLSRLAFGISMVQMMLARVKFASVFGLARWAVLIGAVTSVAYLLFWNFQPFQDRFLEGDVRVLVGTLGVNVSGRVNLWQAGFDSFISSPWIGNGAGSATAVMESQFYHIRHPHNDYLRILNDLGVVGLALWLWGYGNLMRASWRAWRAAERSGAAEARVHLAALLGLSAVAMGMTTDNVMTYIFVMAPLGCLVGASLGRSIRCRTGREEAVTRTRGRRFGWQ